MEMLSLKKIMWILSCTECEWSIYFTADFCQFSVSGFFSKTLPDFKTYRYIFTTVDCIHLPNISHKVSPYKTQSLTLQEDETSTGDEEPVLLLRMLPDPLPLVSLCCCCGTTMKITLSWLLEASLWFLMTHMGILVVGGWGGGELLHPGGWGRRTTMILWHEVWEGLIAD